MSRPSQPTDKGPPKPAQLPLDFDAVMEGAQVLSRDQVAARAHPEEGAYDPVGQTTEYMRRVVEVEHAWETTLQLARERLLETDARQLYLDFLTDLTRQIRDGVTNAATLARLLEQVAVRGLGMSRTTMSVTRPSQGGVRWHVRLNTPDVERHLSEHVTGNYFLNPIRVDDRPLEDHPLPIGASDVSQHRSAIPVPSRYFKRSVPFVLNNAAGALYRSREGHPRYENVFNPKPDEALLRWMLIDPSYQDELEPEDYERCIASAMDVGQYKFDLGYLMKADRRPTVILRDGSLFPQDAYLDNFVVRSKRGDFTREAIRELLDCVSYARQVGIIYCGIAKTVQLKVYSAIVDWFVAKHIDSNWSFGNYTLNDGQAMSLLLASPSFVESNLRQTVSTCLIRRSFTTRANLNTRANVDNLEDYFRNYEGQDIDITPYRRLCEVFHTYMFFIGHSKSPQQQLPRYEFFYSDQLGPVLDIPKRILSALQHCGLAHDDDHSFMAASPVTYLIPSVTHQAHILSKDVGKSIDSNTGQWIMSRYRRHLEP